MVKYPASFLENFPDLFASCKVHSVEISSISVGFPPFDKIKWGQRFWNTKKEVCIFAVSLSVTSISQKNLNSQDWVGLYSNFFQSKASSLQNFG